MVTALAQYQTIHVVESSDAVKYQTKQVKFTSGCEKKQVIRIGYYTTQMSIT